MYPYICITHARADLAEAARLADTLGAYGFRCRTLHEASSSVTRERLLGDAAQVLALTSDEAVRVGTVASDIALSALGDPAPVCISLSTRPNALDERFCHEDETISDAYRTDIIRRIPYPLGESPAPRAVGLFMHHLFLCRLCRIEGAFSPSRCRRDSIGYVIALAVAAYRGDRHAAYALGCAYERGQGIPVLESDAATWITRAAETGLPDARLHLGELCLSGWGVEPDKERAYTLFAGVADEGDVRGEYRLGLCYLNGHGVIPDPTRAVYHLKRAARWGYAPALYHLGLLCRDGIGTAPDARLALQCFYKACRRGAASETTHIGKDEDYDAFFAALDTRLTDGEHQPSEYDDHDRSDSDFLTLSDMAASDSTDIFHMEQPPAQVYPLPPTLYGLRAGSRPACATMRLLRRRMRNSILRHAPERHSTDRRADTSGWFAISRYASAHRPEQGWIGSLTRSTHSTAPGGLALGHPGLHIDREDLAMGIPFDLSDAAVALAGLLERGDPETGLYPHPTRALVWYRYALRRGNTEALLRLANAYRRGHGTLSDPAWAVVLYRMSADWGDVRGQFALAVACERGIGIETDMPEAIRRYEQAALAGYAPAQNNLGGCYESGIGVARNVLTAVEWYTRAAVAGQPEAMCRLGMCYECERGVAADPLRAFELYEKAAEAGHPYAWYRLGVCYDRHGQDRRVPVGFMPHAERYTDAIQCWQTAAVAGVAEASYALALCYAMGHGVRRDLTCAMEYLQNAVQGGCLQATYRLAMCCLEGNGTVRNTARALALLEDAVRLWRTRKPLYLMDTAPLPTCADAPTEAAGNALYMLAYCTLEGMETRTAPLHRTPAERAEALLSEAAELCHVGAITLLGDLYAYGRLPVADGTDPQAVARDHYERAVRVSAMRREKPSPLSAEEGFSVPEVLPLSHASASESYMDSLLACRADMLSVSSIPALVSLAEPILNGVLRAPAGECSEDSEEGRYAWRLLAAAAEQGSMDARVGMAQCLYFGYGQKQNFRAAQHLLKIAASTPGGRIMASLWLGDFLLCGWCGNCLPVEGDEAYLRGLAATPTGSEVGPYILAERRRARLAHDKTARIHLLYRLATSRAMHFSDHAHGGAPVAEDARERQDTFSYLAEAVLMGHPAAREDFARMYAYAHSYIAATAPAAVEQRPAGRRRRALLHRLHADRNDDRPLQHAHRRWLEDYYTTVSPLPRPFRYKLRSTATPGQLSPYMVRPVTPLMLAEALNYLGDCFFFGNGLPVRPDAAACCYREVVSMIPSTPRGAPMPECVSWAQYSLGWCLLHGEGTRRDPQEAVSWLTDAALSHPEACFTLGKCYETGEGVDTIDLRESIKYYRRAVKLGYSAAVDKVLELEEAIRERAETAK